MGMIITPSLRLSENLMKDELQNCSEMHTRVLESEVLGVESLTVCDLLESISANKNR